ncbi:helix-turn-helix domain-containing protein [Streptomyces sp. NPDC087908]|uniref:helix-turn-helix domain-containing protein n=1 Tax=Streptomyces TaxID=1883 RepID=UPI0006E19632|nr:MULTISPECIES: helix-turn-helix transcriptional regulator [Streptomyces]TXS11985.1 XRE family transcriptional regulator [Streptomyces sp. adm13(2018)]
MGEGQLAGQGKKRTGEEEYPAIWVAYGKLVKLFRRRANLTQQGLADATGYSYEQVASIEQGRRPAKAAFTEAAERMLEAGGVLRELQEEVDRAKLPKFFQDFALIETEAVSRFAYDPLVVPGLLQTPEYAKALFSAHCPPLDEETIELHTEARLNRQRLLTRAPIVQLSFIIGQATLVNPMGDEALMRSQLEHLLKIGAMRNVELQVMPEAPGYHPGLNGAFVLLETLEHRHFGYIEAQEVGIVISDPAKVSAFGLRYGKLRSQALNVEESARLVERLAGAA